MPQLSRAQVTLQRFAPLADSTHDGAAYPGLDRLSAVGGTPEITATEIAALANQRVASLVRELLPKARAGNGGRFLEIGSLDGEAGQSLKINLKGKVGLWTDFNAPHGQPKGGDMVHLVALVKFGGVHKEALHKALVYLKSWLGLDTMDPGRVAQVKREASAEAALADAQAERDAAEKRQRAWYLWMHAQKLPRTPADGYLLGRKIDFASLGHAPGALRFRPDLWCPVRSTRENRLKFPAMVAAIIDGNPTDPARAHLGTHRTYLSLETWDFAARSGGVSVVKVPDGKGGLKSHKQSLGAYAGGHIPVWKGTHKQTLREIPEGTPVYMSEGIEDAGSIAMAFPDRRVIAGVSLSNMGGMRFPPQVGPIVFIGQNDAADSAAIDAFERAVAQQQAAGRTVQTIFPPAGYKDFNDLLCGKRKDGA